MSIEEREGRRPRSVRLTTSIDNRLVSLCEHLGVTPNAYLVGVIGKAIATDEMTFLVKSHSNDMTNLLSNFFDKAMQENEEPKEKQLTLDQDL